MNPTMEPLTDACGVFGYKISKGSTSVSGFALNFSDFFSGNLSVLENDFCDETSTNLISDERIL